MVPFFPRPAIYFLGGGFAQVPMIQRKEYLKQPPWCPNSWDHQAKQSWLQPTRLTGRMSFLIRSFKMTILTHGESPQYIHTYIHMYIYIYIFILYVDIMIKMIYLHNHSGQNDLDDLKWFKLGRPSQDGKMLMHWIYTPQMPVTNSIITCW